MGAGGILAATIEANWPTVAIAALMVVLLVVRDVRINSTLGSISTGVEQVNRQVNHVEDPDREPTMRELVIRSIEHAEAARSAATKAVAEAELARVGAAAASEHVARLRRDFEAHVEMHRDQDVTDSAAREGRIDRRQR